MIAITNDRHTTYPLGMIGNSLAEYIFIRTCILVLHSIAPLSLLYCAFVGFQVVTRVRSLRPSSPSEAWILAEGLFYILVHIPTKNYAQRAATHPPGVDRQHRRELFKLCLDHVSDLERYLSKWFLNAPASEIKRDNVKEWLRWAFLSTGQINEEDEEELDEYVQSIETLLDRKLDKGRGRAQCLRLSIDEVDILHRSLVWYSVSLKSS